MDFIALATLIKIYIWNVYEHVYTLLQMKHGKLLCLIDIINNHECVSHSLLTIAESLLI